MKNSNQNNLNLKVGDYVVFTDEQMDLYDLETSLFKILNLNSGKYLSVVDVESVLNRDKFGNEDEDDLLNIRFNEVYKVEVNQLNLFKNYVINSSLSWNESNSPGENLCAFKVHECLNNANSLSDAKALISAYFKDFFNIENPISSDEDFENTRSDYVEIVEYLSGLDSNELLEVYVNNPIYKFIEFDDSEM